MTYNITLENLGTVNKNCVKIGNLTLWFSYSTIVAFSSPETGIICSENLWSKTTGKLLNEIQPVKANRMKNEEFTARLESLIAKLNLN